MHCPHLSSDPNEYITVMQEAEMREALHRLRGCGICGKRDEGWDRGLSEAEGQFLNRSWLPE